MKATNPSEVARSAQDNSASREVALKGAKKTGEQFGANGFQ
jgi:hypothetical protein